ncbi:hypothetical protein [Pseudoalteromonas sp. Angola-7]|uniref:hypothetical protein n=2 Tax=unclassified Pseudoalteromonas TaxID=194690 RepID=UPI00235A0D2E|nr:hypothetical protein [Pseudoalteromonas sp. Angola-7]MDC9530765.1 hypothetical protein [Pseudoalteromonas sp. Angola-7]
MKPKKKLALVLSCCLIFSFNSLSTQMNLDPNNDGLYSDQERYQLLNFLANEYPELEGNYDVDNDSKVTILEQTQGRLPLSMRIPERAISSEKKVPWALNLFPEWLMTAYFQEDAQVGKLPKHSSRGTIIANATQTTDALQPVKTDAKKGIEFLENTGSYFAVPGQRDARWNYRWCIFVFRIDAETGNDEKTTLVDINQGNGSNKSSPKIWYDKSNGLNIQYVGLNSFGLDKRIITTKNEVIADGKTWNVVVTGIRYGQLFASVNGVSLSTDTEQPDRFSGQWLYEPSSYLGDKSTGNMAWAYDTLAFGLTEPSEAMVRKMTGWAAHRSAALADSTNSQLSPIDLPNDHPYKDTRPVMDKEDFPYRYIHDEQEWTEWGKSISPSQVRVNSGNERVVPEGFERVFYDDFRHDRVKHSASGEADLWAAPGFNPAVGASAQLIAPNRTYNAYPHDSDDKIQTLALIKKSDRWRGSAFYSVNDLGHGYTWSGPKVFRIRYMLPKVAQSDLPGGLFPAFWSYNPDFLFWRTANRIEVDWFELDGLNGQWLNGLSSHYHYTAVKNIFAKQSSSYKSYKAYWGELTEQKSNIEGGMEFWDGEYHTWEFIVDTDMTYINVTISDDSGNEKWVEVGRVPTPATYLQRLDIQLDYALKSHNGNPTTEQENFNIDFIEVLQKTSEIEKLPEPFLARPKIVGDALAGNTVECQANIQGVKDVRYYWFASGYPLTYTVKNTFELTNEFVGDEIRCMVKAVGALNMPEAWSSSVTIEQSNFSKTLDNILRPIRSIFADNSSINE